MCGEFTDAHALYISRAPLAPGPWELTHLLTRRGEVVFEVAYGDAPVRMLSSSGLERAQERPAPDGVVRG